MGKQEKKDVTTFNPPALFANRVFIKPFQTPEPPMAGARIHLAPGSGHLYRLARDDHGFAFRHFLDLLALLDLRPCVITLLLLVHRLGLFF